MKVLQNVLWMTWSRWVLWLVVLPTTVALTGCGSSGGAYTSSGYPYDDFYYDRWRWGSCCYRPSYPIGPPDRPPIRPEHPIERPPVHRPSPPVARPTPRPRPRPSRPVRRR